MSTNTFAGGNEICSKGSSGKSTACFPDPCWTPPAPPVGPLVIPYPNTGMASDLTEGSTKVLICNKIAALENISYFKKSTGDEGATQGQPKGVVTAKIQGAAYFIQWAFDVKFEGKGVGRHLDLMTHNHGSQPGNTPPHPYLSTMSPAAPDVRITIICQAICACKDVPENPAKPTIPRHQLCVDRLLQANPANQKIGIYSELAYDMRSAPPKPFLDSAGNPIRDFGKRIGIFKSRHNSYVKYGIRIPDVVLAKPGLTPMGGNNIDTVIEIKFPKDTFSEGQELDYTKIGEGKPILILGVGECCVIGNIACCEEKEPEPKKVPIPDTYPLLVPAYKPKWEPNWGLVAAAAIVIVAILAAPETGGASLGLFAL